jgi:F-type H+-transporting ATPase subunit beta
MADETKTEDTEERKEELRAELEKLEGEESSGGNGSRNGEGKRNIGRIEEIQGVVLEAVFPDQLPEINHALLVEREAGDDDDENISSNLVLEVQQHLGDDRVRCVAMDSTDGLSRGAEVVDTGAAITVPVGDVTLGRIFNLLGEPIDQGEAIADDVERWPIHR